MRHDSHVTGEGIQLSWTTPLAAPGPDTPDADSVLLTVDGRDVTMSLSQLTEFRELIDMTLEQIEMVRKGLRTIHAN